MNIKEFKDKIQHLVERINATGMDVVKPLEMFTLRRQFVILYNQISQFSNIKFEVF
jgi:hypothetical protein